MVNAGKNKQIGATRKATVEKRKSQQCKTFELKVDKSRMSRVSYEKSVRVFLEAKWIKNHVIAQEDIFNVDDKISKLQIKVKDSFEERTIEVLGSQMKQSVISNVQQDIKNLSKSKKAGNKVGRLKFVSCCNSIDLKQHGITYTISGSSVKMQGIKQKFRVRGIDQLKGWEIANAKFIQKSGDFYFHVTCFRDFPEKVKFIEKKDNIGIDYGLSHQATISNGVEGLFIDYKVEFPKRLRKLFQKLSKAEKHSSNWYKVLTKIRAEYEYLTNCKNDIKNKLCYTLKTNFGEIFYQDDCFKGWQRIWGRKMLSIGIGGITARLKNHATAHKVDRFFPSTQNCSRCPNKQKMALDERIFKCNCCGHTAPRDGNSADNILFEGQENLIKENKLIGVEYAKYKPSEMKPLLLVMEKLNTIPRLKASFINDVGSPYSLE